MSIAIMSEVFASDIPTGPRFVLLALADNADDEGIAYPSIRTVGDKCGMGGSTVRRHAQWLADQRLVFDRQRFNDSSVYRIDRDALRARKREGIRTRQTRPGESDVPDSTPSQIGTPSESDPLPDRAVPPPRSSGTPSQIERLTINEPSLEPSGTTNPHGCAARDSDEQSQLDLVTDDGTPVVEAPSVQGKSVGTDEYEAEHGFVEFWTSYPRKVDKRAALRAYRAARKRGVSVESLHLGARSYAAECKGREARYVKHPASWLNADAHANESAPATAARVGPSHAPRAAPLELTDEERKYRAYPDIVPGSTNPSTVTEHEDIAERHGLTFDEYLPLFNRSQAACRRGDWTEARKFDDYMTALRENLTRKASQ